MNTRIHSAVYTLVILLICMAGVASAASPVFTEHDLRTTEGPRWKEGEIIVKFKSDVAATLAAETANERFGARIKARSQRGRFFRMALPAGRSVPQMVAAYRALPEVEYAEPNYIAYAAFLPNDDRYPDQWHFQNDTYGGINLESAWDISRGGPDVVVAVIDTGVAYEAYEEYVPGRFWRPGYWVTYARAPDLAETLFVSGYDFVNEDSHANKGRGDILYPPCQELF